LPFAFGNETGEVLGNTGSGQHGFLSDIV